jgi:hypothetical protein
MVSPRVWRAPIIPANCPESKRTLRILQGICKADGQESIEGRGQSRNCQTRTRRLSDCGRQLFDQTLQAGLVLPRELDPGAETIELHPDTTGRAGG